MAVHRYQVRLQGISNLPEDVYENVLYFDTNAPDTVAGNCDEIAALYAANNLLAGVNAVEVRAYALAGGEPIHQTAPVPIAPIGLGRPHEIAACLSYATEDDPDNVGARRRGRIYLGPTSTLYGSPDRPAAAAIDKVLDFGEQLASVGSAGNTTWMMFSRMDNSAHKIESIWCDNAWDVQRRRGLKPTTREVRDVQ